MSLGPAAGSGHDGRVQQLEQHPVAEDKTLKPAKFGIVDDMDTTPKSEVPLAVNIMTPGATDAAIDQEHVAAAAAPQDYFTSRPSQTELQQQQHLEALQSPAAPTPQSTTASASDITAVGTILDSIAAPANANANAAHLDRPAPYTNASSMSVESTDSAVTVTAIPHAIRPVFPNQAYAALHDQQHQRYVPPLTRQRTSHPVRINNWTNAITSSGRIAMSSRTADNSPALTPAHGLFDVNAAPRREQYRSPDAGTYSSPYLHFTQQQAPKETHVADVDVDPLTGNKLINHYEIVDEIGRGAHGKVKLGRDLESEDTYVAIKIVERYSKRRKLGRLGEPEDKVKKEVAILKKARHPNVVALLEVIDDPSRKKVYIVLEWVSRGQIHWRSKAQSKEIAMIEARRYERERVAVNMSNEHTRAQEEAILAEAQKRLSRKKRQETKKWRQGLKNQPETQAFSHEMMGDNSGDDLSEDERLSRVSSVSATMTARHFPNEGRLPSRPPTPAQPIAEDVMTPTQERETREAFLELTEEPRPSSPATAPRQVNCYTGLEGTMYGAYDPSSGENTRAASRHSSEDLNALARDILDEDLNTELDYVPVMTLQQVRVAFRDTLLGLQYLHHQGIVHRDIKPPNLLSTNEHRVKISDFGVSYLGKAVNEDEGEGISEDEALELGGARELAKTVGTPAFFAPELCITDFGDAEPLPVTKAIDVWALGITLFCMIFARTPFVDNEFVVMRQIAEEEVYIPRKRLVPVVLKPSSRPTSRSRSYNRGLPTGRREPYDLEYEGIDDDLYDLLKRLLIKDPRKRITLEEVRHHPWVVADFPDKLKWLEETDVTSWNEGKIEVSKEDVNAAVVPLFLDRVRSTVKKFGEKLGLSSTNRSRGQSNAGSVNGSPAPSVHSSSTAISQEARKQSLRGDETIFAALHKSREGIEHRLAMSASTSPENSFKATYFDEARSNAGSEVDDNPLRLTRSRPALPDRSRTVMSTSTTGSVRTIRQGDVRHITTESPPPSPGLPGTPLALESPGGHGLSAIMSSGTARRMLNTLRERSTGRSPAGSRAGSERGSSDSLKAHGEASVAVSNTSASGHVNLPETLREGVSENLYSDSERSLPPSALSSPHEELKGVDAASRQSSGQSVSSLTRWLTGSKSASRKASPRPSSRMAGPDTSPEQWQRAEEERNRRLIRERAQSSAKSRERHNFDDRTCPPSPDDQRPTRMSRQPSYANISNTPSSLETSPMSHGITPNPGLVSSSSEFGSAMSMSVSNPSIPSAISETCSYDHKENTAVPSVAETRTDSSDGTINGAFDHEPGTQDDGYNPDSSAVNSEEEPYYGSDSDDSDTGITMGPAKHKVTTNAAPLTPQKGQRDPDLSGRPKKSSRSGSNNTMKKIRTRDSADERRARSPGISEAQDS